MGFGVWDSGFDSGLGIRDSGFDSTFRARRSSLDNLTHSLFALTLGRTPLGRAGRGTTAALLIASNIPDIDIVALAGGGVSYLKWHRGPTHGPLGVFGLGLVSAGLAWGWQRYRDRKKEPLLPAEPRAPFAIPAMKNTITRAYRLADKAPVPMKTENGRTFLNLDRPIFDPMATVVVVEFDGSRVQR